MKRELGQNQGGEDAAELLPNESRASTNVSLLACWQKLPTAAKLPMQQCQNTLLQTKILFQSHYYIKVLS